MKRFYVFHGPNFNQASGKENMAAQQPTVWSIHRGSITKSFIVHNFLGH